MNTFLIAFKFSTISSSMRIGLYNVKVNPCVPNPIRYFKCQKCAHGKGQCKGKLKCFKCSWEDHEVCDCNNNFQSAPIVANLTWLHRKIVIISCKKKRSKKLNQKKISFPEACKNHVSVAKRVFNSVEAMFTWIENTEKPTRLTVKPKEKNCNTITLSIKFFSDSQPFSSNFNYFYKFN